MNDDELGFDIFSADLSEEGGKHEPKEQKDYSLLVEAIQIVRISMTTVGKRREVLDTIVVSYPSMTYERALKIAKHKAKMIGNCMVVEKIERVVDSF